MLTISNGLSFARIPLALLFLGENPYLRCVAVLLAIITDSIDGYLARRSKSASFFGAVLDPIADKFFVYFALVVLFFEGKLLAWQAIAMLSRDGALFLYTMFMVFLGKWKQIVVRSFYAGKVATSLQFIVLIGMIFSIPFPWTVYSLFALIGSVALIELLFREAVTTAARWNILKAHD